MRIIGTIMWISKRDGKGIIITDQGKEFYFDTSVFKAFNSAERKDRVNFILNESIKECLCAKDVNFGWVG